MRVAIFVYLFVRFYLIWRAIYPLFYEEEEEEEIFWVYTSKYAYMYL